MDDIDRVLDLAITRSATKHRPGRWSVIGDFFQGLVIVTKVTAAFIRDPGPGMRRWAKRVIAFNSNRRY